MPPFQPLEIGAKLRVSEEAFVNAIRPHHVQELLKEIELVHWQ